MTAKILISFLAASLMACAPTDDMADDDTGGGDDGSGGGGGGGGGGSGSGSDTTPSTIVLSGSSLQQGQSGASPLAGVAITAYKIGADSTPVATATSDAQGTYSLSIDGTSFDGYVKAQKSGYADTYLYPAQPWTADAEIETSQLGSTTFSLLNTFAGGDSSKGLIIATIVDGSGTPVSGAKITSSPASGSYKYSDGSGQPTGSTSTPADGIAFFMSAPVGQVTISATKSGMTFKSHAVTTHGGALLTTAISE